MNGSSIERGAVDGGAFAETRAVVDRRVDESVAPERGPGALPRLARVGQRARFREVIGLRRVAARDDADAAQQRLLRTEAEAALGYVLVVEALGEVEEPGLVERDAFGNGHAHVEVLARVTHLREQVASTSAAATPVGSSSLSTSCSRSVIRSRTRPRSTCDRGVT